MDTPNPNPEAVKYDLPCPRCGYNLRGLSPGGLCPECGQAVTLAFGDKLLRYADPDWVRTIRCGVRFELSWVLLLPAVLILEFIATRYVAIAGLATCLLFSAASMLITVAEPSANPRFSFLVLRVATAVGLVGILGWIMARTAFRSSIPEIPCMIASFVLALAFFMRLDVLRNHARRLISWDVAAAFSLVIWMGGLAVLVVVMLILVILFSGYVGFFVLMAVIFILVLIVWGTYVNAVTKLHQSITLELDALRMRH
jgi:hypothetical protein